MCPFLHTSLLRVLGHAWLGTLRGDGEAGGCANRVAGAAMGVVDSNPVRRLFRVALRTG